MTSTNLFCISSGWYGSGRKTIRPFSAKGFANVCWTWRHTRSTVPWCSGTGSLRLVGGIGVCFFLFLFLPFNVRYPQRYGGKRLRKERRRKIRL